MSTCTRTRQSINEKTAAACEAAGVDCEFKMSDARGGGVRLLVFAEGEWLTPGEAADKYLPGGFADNFGW